MTDKDKQINKLKKTNIETTADFLPGRSSSGAFKGWLLVAFTALLIILWYYWYLTVAPAQIAQEPEDHFKKITTEKKIEEPVNQSASLTTPTATPTDVQETLTKQLSYIKADQVSIYRNYLREVNSLLVKFLQGYDFEDELNAISRADFPEEIASLLKDLKEYNSLFKYRDSQEKKVVLPKYFRLIEKFISIEKEDESMKAAADLRDKIIDQLPAFTDYFYSQALQQKFIYEQEK